MKISLKESSQGVTLELLVSFSPVACSDPCKACADGSVFQASSLPEDDAWLLGLYPSLHSLLRQARQQAATSLMVAKVHEEALEAQAAMDSMRSEAP